MFYKTLVVYPEDGLHMQAPWVIIWILSCYKVFNTVTTEGLTSPVECPSILNVSLLTYIEHIYNPPECLSLHQSVR